ATRVIAVIAAVVGVLFFLLGFLIGRSFRNNFLFAIGITVALIPEGLLPTVTLALAMGSQRMAKRKALIRTLTSVETLGSVTVICTDKTGTLTQNKMTATKVWTIDGEEKARESLLKIAYLCNNARLIEGQYRGDPTEAALLKTARETIGDFKGERIAEIPFDSERKMMTTLNIVEGRMFAFSKGAMEGLLPLCTDSMINGDKALLDEKIRRRINDEYHSMMDKGLRVLAFAYKEIENRNALSVISNELKNKNSSHITHHPLRISSEEIETDMVFAGLAGLEDPPRPEVPDAIRKCHEAGIKVIMITGDASRTAVAIAKEIGLVKVNPVVIEGNEFILMSDKELRGKLSEREVIFARMTPKHKMRVVSVLQEEGEVVAVTGDGVNDAPALKKADIGIAMGISGTDVAKEASDMVLLDDNFATI
ncbi:MAG: HAD-IC family P-type ATPase, partial [Thermodesulfovibrionales bacterium]|nr:HAD-IC family P-type ATPase [Thermodesulfovibrionales bacterium]